MTVPRTTTIDVALWDAAHPAPQDPALRDPSDEELAWAGGFLDGEGCFALEKGATPYRGGIRVTANQRKHEPLIRLVQILGGKVSVGLHDGTPMFTWRLGGGAPNARRVLPGLIPWLAGKRADAELVLRYARTDDGRRGRKVPESTRAEREGLFAEYSALREGLGHIAIYVPTLGRPGKLAGLVENIHRATTWPHQIVFIVEKQDPDSYEAAKATGHPVIVNPWEPSYSNSLQAAYEARDDPFFIGANDDFDFTPFWDTAALKAMRKGVDVVGINDGQNNPSTISLIRRSYIETQSGVIDMPNRVNYPYRHNYVDTEFHATAVKRGVFAYAPEAVILHAHPDWGHGGWDATYEKSRATVSEDGGTFNERAHLWA